MNTTIIKWVSPTGLTVMHQHPDGTITYSFPDKPHPPLPYKDTSNRGTYGLKARTETAK